MECLENVIKLSRTECECFDADKPVDVSEGKSDIYLDELEGLNLKLIESASDCESGSLWDMMSKSRENATKQFKTDLLTAISVNYTPKRPAFSGIIGSTQFTRTLALTTNQALLKVTPYPIVGGYMTIKQIGLLFNASASFNISVYSNEDETTPIAVYPVTSTANSLQYVTLTTPLKLPLWSKLIDGLEYYFVYDLTGAYLPKDNKSDCGCGGGSQKTLFKNWVNVKGSVGNSPALFSTFTDTTELNGLILDASFTCETSRIICSEDSPLDFENDAMAMNYAYAIRAKAGEMLIEMILASGEINRFTMLDREVLWGKRNRYRALYEEWIGWISNNLQVIESDCLMCRPNSNFARGGIFA